MPKTNFPLETLEVVNRRVALSETFGKGYLTLCSIDGELSINWSTGIWKLLLYVL